MRLDIDVSALLNPRLAEKMRRIAEIEAELCMWIDAFGGTERDKMMALALLEDVAKSAQVPTVGYYENALEWLKNLHSVSKFLSGLHQDSVLFSRQRR